MIRSDGRVIEWHSVRAAPRTPAKKKLLPATATGDATTRRPRRRATKTDKQRLRSKLYNLALDISTLRQQIHDLHETRQLLYTRALFTKFDDNGSLVRQTEAFVDITRPGLRSLDDPHTLATFVSAVSEDITFGPYAGRDQLLLSWREFSRVMRTTHLVIHAIRVLSFDAENERYTVRVDSTSYSSMTVGALDIFYPAVLEDPALTRALVGQPLLLPSVVHITFNRVGQAVQYDVELDLVGVLTKLTADAVRAGELLAQAARERKGLIYLAQEDEETKESQPTATPRVDKLWGVDREPESHDGIDDQQVARTADRHSVDFLLS